MSIKAETARREASGGRARQAAPTNSAAPWLARPVVGIVAVALLLAGGGLFAWGASPGPGTYAGPVLRVGAIFAVLWLAMPELQSRRTRFLLLTLVGSTLVAVTHPRVLKFVLPLIAAFALLAFLRPRIGRSAVAMKRRPPDA